MPCLSLMPQAKRSEPTRPMVASLSLVGFSMDFIDRSVRDLSAAGVVVVVAAGNNNKVGKE